MGRTFKRRCDKCGKYHDVKQPCKAFDKSPNKGNQKPKKPNKFTDDD